MPAYSQYGITVKLKGALAMLRSTGNAMEINRSLTDAYACNKANWSSNFFSYECNATSNSFTITAYGLKDISSYSYSLNSDGERKTLSHPLGPSNKCWRVRNAC
jgi:hypothetical protein